MIDRPAADSMGCNCPDPSEHAALVRRVDASYERDLDRSRVSQQEHSASALRRKVVAASNGAGQVAL